MKIFLLLIIILTATIHVTSTHHTSKSHKATKPESTYCISEIICHEHCNKFSRKLNSEISQIIKHLPKCCCHHKHITKYSVTYEIHNRPLSHEKEQLEPCTIMIKIKNLTTQKETEAIYRAKCHDRKSLHIYIAKAIVKTIEDQHVG